MWKGPMAPEQTSYERTSYENREWQKKKDTKASKGPAVVFTWHSLTFIPLCILLGLQEKIGELWKIKDNEVQYLPFSHWISNMQCFVRFILHRRKKQRSRKRMVRVQMWIQIQYIVLWRSCHAWGGELTFHKPVGSQKEGGGGVRNFFRQHSVGRVTTILHSEPSKQPQRGKYQRSNGT